ncbi:hypothetical protein [Bacillus salipaludis]|uniref:Uncharacterized protein n=1 Tax=Bacillus salipaludis TaxID=2547811 RepID=A0AA90R0S1_9BACI|nr:hypothetical protein [Bacillus salipaludis]MDQ6598073.1 hypothetical protein [Bacillus salipaludis]
MCNVLAKLKEVWCGLVNELLEEKLTIARIKVQLLDLTGELIAEDLSDKDYTIQQMLKVVEYIDEYDVKVCDIEV